MDFESGSWNGASRYFEGGSGAEYLYFQYGVCVAVDG